MYSWIWRKLPGGTPGKIIGTLVLLILVAALLFFYVFPWVEPRLPVGDVTVDSQLAGSQSVGTLSATKLSIAGL